MHPLLPTLTNGGKVLKEADDLLILRVAFDFKMTFDNIFAQFSEQLLKCLVSCGSAGKYSTIDCFLGDAFGVLSCPFWSTVLQCGARLPIPSLNYCTVQSVVPKMYGLGDDLNSVVC